MKPTKAREILNLYEHAASSIPRDDFLDAAEISTDVTPYELTFDTPQIINEEVRIFVESNNGVFPNQISAYFQNTDIKPGEIASSYRAAGWTDVPTYDCAYRYKYYLP
ncbi:hypothetical protein ES708_35038 [subsurface metagenome]